MYMENIMWRTWNSIYLSDLHVVDIIYISSMYACKVSINYIDASTCTVYVVAYNMCT